MTILDLIDTVVRDYGTSADAMRWTPGPVEEPLSSDPVEVAVGWLPAGLPHVYTPASYEPGLPGFREIMPVVCAWLAGNGFAPNRVPLDAVPVMSDRWVWCRVHLHGADGRIVWRKSADGVADVVTVVQRRIRRLDPPDELWPWLYTADVVATLEAWLERRLRLSAMRRAYGRRMRARRRRR